MHHTTHQTAETLLHLGKYPLAVFFPAFWKQRKKISFFLPAQENC